jgi:hypothetical protein
MTWKFKVVRVAFVVAIAAALALALAANWADASIADLGWL